MPSPSTRRPRGRVSSSSSAIPPITPPTTRMGTRSRPASWSGSTGTSPPRGWSSVPGAGRSRTRRMAKYGLLLPHFGEEAPPDKLLAGARRAEALGFDSVWVRDHLVYEPHGELERPDRTFYEALTTLTAVGAVTSRIGLGTAALIPFRHPLVTAQIVTTMTQLFGPRLILGFGIGNFDHEFAAVGLGGADRHALLRGHIEILRRVMSENDVTYRDEHFRFEHVTLEPKPRGGPIPLWHCGSSPRSARLAVDLC